MRYIASNDVVFGALFRKLLFGVDSIFNRWGEGIYESADINEGWDGDIIRKQWAKIYILIRLSI